MKIAESNVAMASKRTYQQTGTRMEKETTTTTFQHIVGDMYESGRRRFNRRGPEQWLNYGRSGIHLFSMNSYSRLRRGEAEEYQNELLKKLFFRMREGGLFSKATSWSFGENSVSFSVSQTSVKQQTQGQVAYSEQERTNFQTMGYAVTEDGRTIDFNVELSMSRTYMEYMEISTEVVEQALTDPLVINVGAGVAELSDQKFLFDLDGDGRKEEISTLGSGSGFLALDLNGDGIINDGNELFGTKSGDGFADLRKYDKDGNGWIDENDDIFFKLKVWCKGKNGEDILMNLKEADVGAIFLGAQATEFTLASENGRRNGVIRSTGIYLKESGGSGTIQHVDFAMGEGGR